MDQIKFCPYDDDEMDVAHQSLATILEHADEDFFLDLFNIEEDFLSLGFPFDEAAAKHHNMSVTALMESPVSEELMVQYAEQRLLAFVKSLEKGLNLSNIEAWAMAELCIDSAASAAGLVEETNEDLPELLN